VLEERPIVALRSLLMPGVHQVIEHHPDGPAYVLADPATGSWARAHTDGTGHARVAEHGPRRLWKELCAVTDTWIAYSQPPVTSYGLTIHPDGQHELWLDTPHGPRWPLPT
jgi:hypothetical protein